MNISVSDTYGFYQNLPHSCINKVAKDSYCHPHIGKKEIMDTIINFILVTALGIVFFVGPILILALLLREKKNKIDNQKPRDRTGYPKRDTPRPPARN